MRHDESTRGTLVARLDATARRRADAIALDDGTDSLTYAQLIDAVNAVAAHLRSTYAVAAGDLVALSLPPSIVQVVALLAILRCGAGYVPLDAAGPESRHRMILQDARPVALIGDAVSHDPTLIRIDAEALSKVIAEGGPGCVDSSEPAGVAYVIYTSGTTGRPKGVAITHANVLALLAATGSLFDFRPDDAWLMFHSIAFDFSVWELWGALHSGARLVLPDRWTRLSPPQCADLIVRSGVTVLNQTPTAFGNLAPELLARGGNALRYVIFGGERLSPSLLRTWARERGLEQPALINMYGLTEACVHTTFHRVVADDLDVDGSIIGTPLPGFIAKVIDVDGRDAGRGELCVAGPQVAAGYLDRPELSAERFRADDSGTVFYHTGDLVDRDARGRLCFLGRNDRQVKIRGHRLELGEVEARLRDVPHIADAAVFAVAPEPGDGALCCAYTTNTGRPIAVRDLRSSLRDRLPPYMIPARFRWRAELPVTANSKIDIETLRHEMETFA